MITGSFQFALFDLVDACTHKMNQSGYKKIFGIHTISFQSTWGTLIVAFVNRLFGPLILRNCHWSCYIFLPSLPADECGIVAQVSAPLAQTEISTYYICTFYTDHTLVSECVLSRLWLHLFSYHCPLLSLLLLITILHYQGIDKLLVQCSSSLYECDGCTRLLRVMLVM